MDNKEIRVYFATRLRGFFKHMTINPNSKIKFVAKYNNMYEVNSKYKQLLLPIFRSNLFNQLGVIRRIECIKEDYEYIGSFNRFLKTNKPYFIYLENPTALYEYSLGRNKSFIGKKKIGKFLKDKNLKYIVCMSKACKNTLDEVLAPIPRNITVNNIYPYVPSNKYVNLDFINKKSNNKTLKCLFIAQGIRFISKGGKEVIEVFKEIKGNIELTIITNKDIINKEILRDIEECDNIKLIEFNLSYDKLQKIYAESNILIHPTSDDSFGLTVLEAMKSGITIITTSLYAIPEMIENNVNGYLIEPKYYLFNKDNLPNPDVWNNRNKTIYLEKSDEKLKCYIKEKINILYNDRNLLRKMSISSYHKSNSGEFNCENIMEKWHEVIKCMKLN